MTPKIRERHLDNVLDALTLDPNDSPTSSSDEEESAEISDFEAWKEHPVRAVGSGNTDVVKTEKKRVRSGIMTWGTTIQTSS